MEPIALLATPHGEVRISDARELFEAGGHALDARRYEEALRRYDELLANFPNSRLAALALYNAGLSHEGRGQFASAAARYRSLLKRFGASEDAKDASFRLGACYAEIRDWPASARIFAALARRSDLSASERVEAYAREGFARFRQGDYGATRTTLREGLRLLRRVAALERLESDFFAAMLHFYLAATSHAQFRVAPMEQGDALATHLDEKARLLLVAEGAYIDTIRAKNPYWATAAGFQIGSLYREFYDALMRAQPDFTALARQNARDTGIAMASAKEQLAEVYLELLHERIRPLLEKAMRVFERNVVVAEQIAVQGQWIDKSRRQISELQDLITASPAEAVRSLPEKPVLPEDLASDSASSSHAITGTSEGSTGTSEGSTGTSGGSAGTSTPASPPIRGSASRAVM